MSAKEDCVKMNERDIIPSEVIEKRIFVIRGQKVMLDFHIAEL